MKDNLLWIDEPDDYYDKHGLWSPYPTKPLPKIEGLKPLDYFFKKNPELFLKPFTQLNLPLSE